MSCTITVIARVDEEGTWLPRLVASLDAQDLPYDEFQVIFLVPDPDSGAGRRLTELSGRRPNVCVAAAGKDDAALARTVTGEWVLDLGHGLNASKPVLFPQALSRLAGFGASHGCQAVLGRAVDATGGVVDDLFVSDRPRLADGAALAASGHVIVLRRDLAPESGLSRLGAGQWLASARDVGVFGTYPSVLITPAQPAAAGTAARVGQSTAEWRNGRIVVTAAGSAGDSATCEVLFGICHQGSGLEYWLPSTTADCGGGAFSGRAEIDVRTAALGSPLSEGFWTVSVGVTGGPTGRHVRMPLPPTPLVPGLVDGIPVVPARTGGQFALDIGGSRTAMVPPLRPADVAIAESASGTLMTIRLDRLAVAGDSRTQASLYLGKLPLIAYLVAEGGHARIECLLSGLAGTSALSAQFGAGKPQPAGLNLEISATGVMTVVPAPEEVAGVSAHMPPRARARAGKAERSVVARLRHRIPAPLEPAVRSLARNKIAARAYRALTGHGGRR